MVSPNSGDLIQLGIAVETDGDGAKAIRNLKKEYGSLEDIVKRANKATAAQAEAVNDVEKALAKVERRKALEDLARDASRSKSSVDKLTRALKEVGASGREVDFVIRQFEKLERQAASAQRQMNAQSRFDAISGDVGLAGDVQSNLGAVQGLAGAAGFGGAGEAVGVAGEVVALAEELPRLKEAASGLPKVLSSAVTALGPTGLGLAAVVAGLGVAAAIASSRLQKQTEEIRKQNELAQQALRAEAELTGETSDVIGDAFADAQDQIEVEARVTGKNLEDYASQLAGFNERFGTSISEGQLQEGAGRRTFLRSLAVGNDEYQNSLTNLFDAYDNAISSTDALAEAQATAIGASDALKSSETEKADAEAKAAQAARDRIAVIEQQSRIETEARLLGESASQEQLDARLQEIQIQKDAASSRLEQLQQEDQSVEEVAQATAAAEAELNRLVATETALKNITEPLIEQREREAEVAGLLGDAIAAGKKKVEQASEAIEQALAKRASEQQRLAETAANAIIKAEDEITSIRQRTADRVAEINRQTTEKLESAALEQQTALAEADRDARDAREDAARDANNAIIELEANLKQRRNQINREATRSLLQAAGDRNAAAAVAARERKENEMAQLKEEEETRSDEIQRQLQAQTEDINRNLIRQRETINRQYQQQVRDAQRSAQAQIQLEQQKAQQEIAIRQKQIQAELNALRTLDSAAQQFANNFLSYARQLGSSRSSIFSAQVPRGNTTRPARARRPSRRSSSSGGGNLIQRATNFVSGIFSADAGAIVERGGLINVTAGESILRPRQMSEAASGRLDIGGGTGGFAFNPTINVNAAGMSRTQIRRIASEEFDRSLNQALDQANIR